MAKNKPSKRPPFFDLKNYPSSKDPKYWAIAIQNRLSLLADIEEWLSLGKYDQPSSQEHLKSIIDAKFKNLFVASETFYGESPALDLHLAGDPLTAKPMTIAHYRQLQELVEGIEEYERSSANVLFEPEASIFFRTPLTDLTDFDMSGLVPYIIDTHQDIESIVKALRESLPKVGNQQGRPVERKHFSAKQFAEWNTYRVLAYSDLLVWEKLSGQKLNNGEKAALLWEDSRSGFGDRFTVRDAVERHYKIVFQSSTVRRLRMMYQHNDGYKPF